MAWVLFVDLTPIRPIGPTAMNLLVPQQALIHSPALLLGSLGERGGNGNTGPGGTCTPKGQSSSCLYAARPKKPWGHWCQAQGGSGILNCPEERDVQSTDETLLEGKNVLEGEPGKISQLIRKAPL